MPAETSFAKVPETVAEAHMGWVEEPAELGWQQKDLRVVALRIVLIEWEGEQYLVYPEVGLERVVSPEQVRIDLVEEHSLVVH